MPSMTSDVFGVTEAKVIDLPVSGRQNVILRIETDDGDSRVSCFFPGKVALIKWLNDARAATAALPDHPNLDPAYQGELRLRRLRAALEHDARLERILGGLRDLRSLYVSEPDTVSDERAVWCEQRDECASLIFEDLARYDDPTTPD